MLNKLTIKRSMLDVKSISLFLFIFCINPLDNFGQEIWHNGFVVTHENDTIQGEIKLLDYDEMSMKCVFKSQHPYQDKTYFPLEIKSYGLSNSALYVSKKLPKGETLFLEYLVDGKLDLFFLKGKDRQRYFIQTDSLPLKEIEYINEIRNINGANYHYKSKVHIGLLAHYTRDAPNLYEAITKLKPDFDDLRKFAVTYHDQVCKTEKCIIFRNDESYLHLAIGPHIGITSYDFYNDAQSIQPQIFAFGMLVRLSTPRISKHFIFRSGAIISKNNVEHYGSSSYKPDKIIVKIPVQFEYLWPISEIAKPKASLGFNYYTFGNAYLGASLGLDIRLTSKSVISIMVEKEIYQVFQSISANTFYSVMLGTYYRF